MILIGIPYHKEKRYSLTPLFDWLDTLSLDYEPLLRVDTGEYGRKNAIKEQFEAFRQYALAKPEISHLYICEADTILPPNGLEKLLSHNMDVVSGLYYYRDGLGNAVAWPNEALTDGLCAVDGTGTGSLLLSRKALQAVSWYDYDQQDADYPYMDLLRSKGFQPYIDMDVRCKHYATADIYC